MNKIFGFTSQNDKNISEDIDFAIKNDFKSYSLNISYRNDLSNFGVKELNSLKYFSDNGGIFIIHLPYFLPTNTCISEIFDGVINYIEKVILKFLGYGLSIITLHGGYIEDKNNKKDFLIENLKKLLTLTNKYGIELSIENDDSGTDYPICTKKDLEEILYGLENIKFCYNIGHYNTVDKGGIKNIFSEFKERINILHVHNNFGEDTHNNLGSGNIDIKDFSNFLIKENKNPIIIFELNGYNNIIDGRKFFI